MKNSKKFMYNAAISQERVEKLKEVELTPEMKDALSLDRDFAYIKSKPEYRIIMSAEDMDKLIRLAYGEGIVRMQDVMTNMDQEDIDIVYTQARREIKRIMNGKAN